MNNQRRAEEVMAEWAQVERFAPDIAQELADASPPILMPDLPKPDEEGIWISFKENRDEYVEIWVSYLGTIEVDGSRRFRKSLSPEQGRTIALALLAAADHAEQEQGNEA